MDNLKTKTFFGRLLVGLLLVLVIALTLILSAPLKLYSIQKGVVVAYEKHDANEYGDTQVSLWRVSVTGIKKFSFYRSRLWSSWRISSDGQYLIRRWFRPSHTGVRIIHLDSEAIVCSDIASPGMELNCNWE